MCMANFTECSNRGFLEMHSLSFFLKAGWLSGIQALSSTEAGSLPQGCLPGQFRQAFDTLEDPIMKARTSL